MFTDIKYNRATANPDLQIKSLIYFRYKDYQMKEDKTQMLQLGIVELDVTTSGYTRL